ncbi:MAG: bifunctional 4-hydroxy-3-methylbut-2-enyl diphosphate reductase/30S ribosomal protein S1, partial [Eubacteriales bacterium]|nr:bifunctional 4-hydroxy-3-methylbut-2-enyl diphosphate reductase/30S ribosomal protein S1 [Eubacteriales bacterium]
MKIVVAENIGFCFGVRRAVDAARNAACEKGAVYTLGELIHNDFVLEELRSEGIFALQEPERAPDGSTVIIRSHGVGPEVYKSCARLNVVDATCPFVEKIHEIVKEHAENGYQIAIAGRPDHPEVIGINGWCGGKAVFLQSAEDASALPAYDKLCLVAQTTFPYELFDEIVNALPTMSERKVFYTICPTTLERQAEAARLSKICTAMIVVGDRNSANTRKLCEVCRKWCKHTQSVSNHNELSLEKIQTNDIIGVVAGASTPDRIIREVITRMSELEKTMAEETEVEIKKVETEATDAVAQPVEAEPAAETTEQAEPVKEPEAPAEHTDNAEASFAEAFEKTLVRIRNGQILKGSVVQIVDGEVCVNIGYKSDGFIPRNEYSSDPDVNPADTLKVGDEIEVEVIKVNDGEGNVLLSRKNVESKRVWDNLLQDDDIQDKVFTGVGKEVVKGGLIASIDGVRAFVPASQLSTKYVENIGDYVGKELKLKVIEVDKSRKRIVASHKAVLALEAEEARKEKWGKLEVGARVAGTVRRITDFGAFVDIGGIDGLVHVTDVAWGRVKHPSDVLSIGQEIEVIIRDVDVEKQRVSLGYKQLQPKPWTMADEKYPVGSVVEGKVVRIVPFGAFVALEPTIDGLIHISQVGVKRIVKVEDEINVGDIVRCKVLEVNPEAKRISLSRRDVILDEHPEILEELVRE